MTATALSCGPNKVNETTKKEAITTIISPTGANSEEPNLVKGLDGNLYMSWIEREGELAILKYAKWEKSNG